MWREPWPPHRPGGYRPPDGPPFGGLGEQLALYGLLGTGTAGLLVWSSRQLAGRVFGHTWLDLGVANVASILWALPHHLSDPALAWPTQAQGALPGPVGMYASAATVVGGTASGTATVMRHLPGRAAGHRPGREHKHRGSLWASGRELRLLTVRGPTPGRVILGHTPGLPHVGRRLLAAEDCHSVLIFGPTGSFKTSAAVIPGILEWSGPLVATSVKPDVLRATLAQRSRKGEVLVLDPLGASGLASAQWSPLASCGTWAGAQQTAVQLANAIEQTPTEEQRPEHRFWKTMGTKFLAPLLFAAATKGLSMAEVLHWLDTREDTEINDLLAATGVQAAQDAWESSQSRTDRAVDSLYATAEEVLHVYANERVAAFTDGHALDLDYFLSGDNTIYLYAPAHQQRLLRPLFETITQQVVATAQEKAARSPDGMLSPRLGLFLDEAGNCAALSELDVLATTARGQGIQLVTVWHDKSQLEARYGSKASMILNNHRAKLFLSGLADLSALELGAKLIGERQTVEHTRSMSWDGRHSVNESVGYRPLLPIEDLRRLRPGEGVLVYGHLRPTPIQLRPYYTPAEQRRRGRVEARAERRLARAEQRRERATARAAERAGRARRGVPERPGWAERLRVLRAGGRDARGQREEV
jgi:type IV secretory pathway TraG/TraD family ATPase VirD4